MNHSKRTKTVLGIGLAAALLALTACGGDAKDSDAKGTSDEPTAPETSEASQPAEGADLEDIPDVVAEVNGQEVTKEEFVAIYEAQLQQAAMEAQTTGQKPDEAALMKQTADGLVDTELLRQEADSRGISTTDAEVDDTLAGLAQQNKMASADEFLAALEKQGSPEDLVRGQIETQIVVERLVEDETGSVEPTEAELRKIYDAAVKEQKQAGKQAGQQPIPPFAKVKPQLVERVKTDKQNNAAQALLDELRKDADITINL
jgi:SurA N-terminal domain